RARFGADGVTTALRVDPEGLPPGWSIRVLAGLAALAVLHEGSVLVEADTVQVKGLTGMKGATAEIARVLADQLGQGAQYSVEVAYDAALDPAAGRPAPEACVAAANAVLAAGKITFAPGSAEIDGSARRTLEDLARVLQSCPDAPIEIGGHTDSQGRAETNLALSERRAEAVRAALRALRVPVSTITARGYGAEEPIADNATEEGRETNRRIAFRLLVPDGAAPEPVAEAVAGGPAGLRGPDDPAGEGTFGPAGDDDADGDVAAAEDAGADPAAAAPVPAAAAAPIIAGVFAAPAGEAGTPREGAAAGTEPAATSYAPQAPTLRPLRRPADRTAP
ncbi:MAG: OmpA family protein, partial [Gemmobacter sp.]